MFTNYSNTIHRINIFLGYPSIVEKVLPIDARSGT